MVAPVLVVTGLLREASLTRGLDAVVVTGGGDSAQLMSRLDGTDPAAIAGVISFGLAGALDPNLSPGDLVVGSSVVSGAGEHPVSGELARRWSDELRRTGIPYRSGSMAGVDAPVLTPVGKAELRRRTGADAVDMESHLAAAYAARHGLPFGALRVISDGADRALPPIAGTAMRPDGSIDIGGVVAGLLKNPRQIPALIATARDAAVAFRALRRVRGLLSLRGGLVGLDL